MAEVIAVHPYHDGAEPGTPLGEALRFGLQDRSGALHDGHRLDAARLRFDLELEPRGNPAIERPDLRGPFVQGPRSARFLYLSWKRLREHTAPWGWRIKVPLSGIGWSDIAAAGEGASCLAFDATGRRPHTKDAVRWHVEPRGEP